MVAGVYLLDVGARSLVRCSSPRFQSLPLPLLPPPSPLPVTAAASRLQSPFVTPMWAPWFRPLACLHGASTRHPAPAEGSLLIWMQYLKDLVWYDDGFVAEGCPASSSVAHAVSMGGGIQFADLYPVAEKRGRLVNGGSCTSVGMAGCTIGG